MNPSHHPLKLSKGIQYTFHNIVAPNTGVRLPGLVKQLTRGTENMSNVGIKVSEEEDPPPPLPRHPGQGIDNQVSPKENPPQAPPRPVPRKKTSSVNSPVHDRDRHR